VITLKGELLLEDALSKALRPFLRGASQSRRISQGFFRSLAGELRSQGYSITHVESKEEIKTSEHKDARVFLIGGTDVGFKEDDYSLLDGRLAFVQNLEGRMSEQVRPLPIGVEDFSYARNGMPWNFHVGSEQHKSETLLVGPFRPTSPSRARLLEIASSTKHCTVIHERLPALRYAILSTRHRYVACPEGNGFDTHRFWETLYRGSIPVVIDSQFMKNWRDLGIPMVALNDWTEIDQLPAKSLAGDFDSILHWTLETESWKKLLLSLFEGPIES